MTDLFVSAADYRAWLVMGVTAGLVMVLLGAAGLVYARRDRPRALDGDTRIEVGPPGGGRL